MATIREKGPGQWHAQVRRMGWPIITETKRTRKDAEAWARDVESQMDRGVFVDRSAGERTTFGETIKTYIKAVTEKRPGEASRAAEKSRLERFMRDEPKLCAYAVAHLRPEHFEEYRDRRLTEFVTRGKPGGRGQYKPEKRGLPYSLDGRVFPITADALKSAFNRARHKLGLDHYRFHDIRHELISSLIEAGWSDTQVMAQSAHRDPKSLKRYTNLRKKHLADALAAIPSRRSKK